MVLAAEPRPDVFVESQAWWDAAGLSLDPTRLRVGQHVHVGCTFPMLKAATGSLRLDLRLVFHGQPAGSALHRVRAMNPEGHRFWDQTKGLPDLINDWPVTLPVVLSLDGLAGWQEMRFSAMVLDAKGVRQFQSSAWFVYAGATAVGLPKQDVTGKGWYEGRGYTLARIAPASFPSGPIGGVWSPRLRCKPGSGGKAIKEHLVTIDPDFHNGQAGVAVRYMPGGLDANVPIDTRLLSNGPHRLAVISSDGFNAGVLVIPFIVQN